MAPSPAEERAAAMRETSAHESATSQIIEALAEQLVPGPVIHDLRFAALVHDVGKIGIPDYILSKRGPLSADEYSIVKAHAVLGWRIINVFGYHGIAEWVRHHHERWDGGGYPDGLRETEIPLESRLLALADTYDALTNDHTYRPSREPEVATALMEEHAGTQFDPVLVPLVRRALEAGTLPPWPGHAAGTAG